jgi:hypothetical protein
MKRMQLSTGRETGNESQGGPLGNCEKQFHAIKLIPVCWITNMLLLITFWYQKIKMLIN